MNHLQLSQAPLDVSAITEMLSDGKCGAISLFVGTTRDNFDGKKVLSLEYEAYEPMAIKQMTAICEDVRQRWTNVAHIVIYHRLGLVPEREASVVIGASSPHRQDALEAVAFAIEELKRRVPIWKKELYDDEASAELLKRRQRRKRAKLDFALCQVQADDVPANLVQIAAAEEELQRRIKCFVEKKREEIDMNNILDFTTHKRLPRNDRDVAEDASSEGTTCARTDTTIVKQEHSNCHLRVRRVKNQTGPQIKSNYLNTLDSLMCSPDTGSTVNGEVPTAATITAIKDEYSSAVHERLHTVEQYLGLPANMTRRLYARIKAIEDRILHLESLSPEYKHFMPHTNQSIISSAIPKHCAETRGKHQKKFTVEDLDALIEMEEPQAVVKMEKEGAEST